MRFDILRRDVERHVLTPLRTHGWKAEIEQEIVHGEYVIVVASRGGARRRIAVLYTPATANDVYKRAATQVEHIFFNGAPYMVESYAYGVDKPVGPVSEFGSLLLKWNAESAVGKFAPPADAAVPINPTRRELRMLLSEEPIEAIWLRLRQLQSVTLTEKMIKERSEREGVQLDQATVRSKAEGVAYALRNAADYFHAREDRNVSQRVLNLYYGSLAFAFAEILAAPAGARTLGDLEESTKQGHGLYTVDGATDGLEHLVVGVIAGGFFPAWMRSMHMPTEALPQRRPRLSDDLAKVPSDTWITVERLFASIPEVADLFADIFDSPPRWIAPVGDMEANMPRFGGVPPSRTYIKLVDEFGRLTLDDIAAFPGPISEISEVDARGDGRHFRVVVDHEGKQFAWDALHLHHSPFKRTALLLPILSAVNEYRAICVVLLYALSIIVRYRPSIWRRVQEGDLDHMRVLIEAFLAVVERVLPEQFLETVTGHRVFAKQPGSF
jgi:hypothetical protein